MDQKTFTLFAGVIFAIVALLHLLRIYMGWPVVVGDWTVPMWVSWIALVVVSSLQLLRTRPRAASLMVNLTEGKHEMFWLLSRFSSSVS